jgi:hypothetical protein
MSKENKNYICCRIQKDTMKNLGDALTALSQVHTDEHYYNYELANACHELRMKIIPMIHECHEELNQYKSPLDNEGYTK